MFLIILAALVVGGVVGGAIVMGMREDKQAEFFSKQVKDKSDKKEKILAIFSGDKEVTNNEIEKALGVSDATATRYLDELEREGKIEQIGIEGRGVVYRLK